MALWTYRIDALDINDHVNFAVVEVPQQDNLPPGDNVLVEMAGDWPDYIRWQPTSGLLTVNMFACQSVGGRLVSCTEQQWAQRIDTLKATLTPGLHDFVSRAKGWTVDKKVRVAYRSMGTNYQLREISLELVAPKPVWVPV